MRYCGCTRRSGQRVLGLLCVLVLVAPLAAAPSPSSTIAPPPAVSVATAASAATPADAGWQPLHGVLFRVSWPQPGGADNLVMGTFHVGTPQQLGIDEARLAAAMDGHRQLVNEVDDSQPWNPGFDHYRFLADGHSLPMLLGGLAFIELATQLPEQDSKRLARLKPWVAMTLLEADQDRPGAHTLDRTIDTLARQRDMPVMHLETLEDQLAALDCVPAESYAVVLRQRLDDPVQLRLDNQRAREFYRRGDLAGWLADIDAMRGLDAQGKAIERRARQCLIEQRNARWLEELEPLLRKGGCFVAVGAIHLAGRHGLLAQLARHGFTVSAQPW